MSNRRLGVDWTSWVAAMRPEREGFRGPTLEAALAWCLVWLLRDEFLGGEVG